MSVLFTVENKIVKPNTETLLIHPFSEIWNRDVSEDKMFAIEDFSYIEFMESVRKTNPYSGYDAVTRREKLISELITRSDWVEDDLIIKARAKMREFQVEASVTYNYYMSSKIAAEKMQNFFTTFSMTTVNERSGLPLYKPKDITSALNDTSRVLENLSALRDKVDNEIFEAVKNKGQKVISPFANPDSL